MAADGDPKAFLLVLALIGDRASTPSMLDLLDQQQLTRLLQILAERAPGMDPVSGLYAATVSAVWSLVDRVKTLPIAAMVACVSAAPAYCELLDCMLDRLHKTEPARFESGELLPVYTKVVRLGNIMSFYRFACRRFPARFMSLEDLLVSAPVMFDLALSFMSAADICGIIAASWGRQGGVVPMLTAYLEKQGWACVEAGWLKTCWSGSVDDEEEED
ncbi:hypothetical protein HYH03_010607 [Edaphochlamys debaryana]|uniref:Uncharacterized protein n=1 Tax=Edaphochlamys debaryana TaxID=47281 RepID=A0A836BVZ7_9CHLO|nr:hypothetical protein HYH03_010607 [Edaphochlamys debaryana]|eukprot:KAG2490930.1 hypothetical protein HYH03_010607 [Edaphochlamys debaryana]